MALLTALYVRDYSHNMTHLDLYIMYKNSTSISYIYEITQVSILNIVVYSITSHFIILLPYIIAPFGVKIENTIKKKKET